MRVVIFAEIGGDMSAVNVLERELSTFQEKKPALVKTSLGKFAVIYKDQLLALCDTYEDALDVGYEQVGVDDPFLVKQVALTDRVYHVYRGSIIE